MSDNKRDQDILIDFTNSLEESIGPQHGISPADFASIEQATMETHGRLQKLKESGEIGFFDLHKSDTKPFKKFASRTREKFENFVVLGIGGSALGTNAIHSALNSSFHNSLTKRKRNGYPKLLVVDNIDPDWLEELLQTVDLKKTIFNVISKSGTTAETMSQFMIVVERLKKKLKGKWKNKIVLTTDGGKGVLRELADEFNLLAFDIPNNVGGRFSVFTSVGLLPLACAGVDIDSLLKGAERMAQRCAASSIMENPAYLFGALHYLADRRKGKNISVMMPYSSKLYSVADWYRQLWAESLGKRYSLDGKECFTGQTPVKALGATDQHSQVQLYVEGPHDKITTFIEVENFSRTVTIPKLFEEKEALKYLGGKSLNQLISTEMKGTEYALTSHNRPNLTIRLPKINAHAIGQLIFMLETATAFAGGLYGINPFDQPGVEFGKQFTYAKMGREGFEKMRSELEEKTANAKRRTI